MDFSLSNSLVGSTTLNPDKLSLDLQFATDKSLTARKGPTPVFTRASSATNYGPLVQFGGETYPATGIVNGRTEWKIVNGSDYKSFYYTGSTWRYEEFTSGEGSTNDSAATTAFRPEQADWSASGLASSPTTSSTFGIVRAATNEPRFDHDPVTLASKGLLIEESRTNLCLQSNAFSTSPWGNINAVCAVTQNQTGPDGVTNSAWTFTDDSITVIEGRFLTASLTSGVAYSFSIFVKKTTGTPTNYPAIWLARSGTFGGCVINTTAGTATAITVFAAGTIISTTASVVDFGNFWRVTSFITPTATGSWEISVSPSGNGSGTGVMDGTITGSAVFWGAQLEVGAFPTSYIPTTTASVVRSADLCSITGSAFTGMYNQTEGSVFVEGSSAGVGSGTFGTASMFLEISRDATNRIQLFAVAGVAVPIVQTASIVQYSPSNKAYTANTVMRQTLGIRSVTTSSAFLNNTAYTGGTNLALTTFVATGFYIGTTFNSGNLCNGHIKQIRYYKKRLANAKLQTLTV